MSLQVLNNQIYIKPTAVFHYHVQNFHPLENIIRTPITHFPKNLSQYIYIYIFKSKHFHLIPIISSEKNSLNMRTRSPKTCLLHFTYIRYEYMEQQILSDKSTPHIRTILVPPPPSPALLTHCLPMASRI